MNDGGYGWANQVVCFLFHIDKDLKTAEMHFRYGDLYWAAHYSSITSMLYIHIVLWYSVEWLRNEVEKCT